jgi:UDP-N-acetylmuramate: L-alanyl-gamma-D-glutamyl-meso-diaminopimelate ligase
MHNLALALHNKGYQVTGSDDAIFEPSKSKLDKRNFTSTLDWFPEK